MKREVDFKITSEEHGEFIEGKDGLVRTRREHEVIDYDELMRKKHLSKHEEFEARVIKHILDREREPN